MLYDGCMKPVCSLYDLSLRGYRARSGAATAPAPLIVEYSVRGSLSQRSSEKCQLPSSSYRKLRSGCAEVVQHCEGTEQEAAPQLLQRLSSYSVRGSSSQRSSEKCQLPSSSRCASCCELRRSNPSSEGKRERAVALLLVNRRRLRRMRKPRRQACHSC